MKRGWPLRLLVTIAFVTVTGTGLLLSYVSARRFLRVHLEGALDAQRLELLINDFASAFLAFSVTSLVVAGVLAFGLGTVARGWLLRLRSDVRVRASGDATAVSAHGVVELRAVAAAVDRLAADLERRAAESSLERDDLRMLVGSVSEGVLFTDPAGRILHANPAARRLLGLPEECRGLGLRSLVRSTELRTFADRLGADAPSTIEVGIGDRHMLVVGRSIPPRPVPPEWLRDPARTDRPDSGAGAVIAFVDLTEVRRLEGVRRDFVANASHELKTPLTSIRGYVETLLTDDPDPATRRQFLDVIQKNAERLHSIVDDLLDLSRLESGGWRPDIQAVDTARAIDEAWAAFAARARAAGVSFEASAQGWHVRADPAALHQILSNLFDNALRHTPSGGSIRVRVGQADAVASGSPALQRPSGEGDRTVIEVEDTGSGIAGDALPRIFERFYRADPARSRAEGGTGLGLSIVKHLVESMDGDVSAASELGKGTTIRIRLPAAAAPVA